MGQGFSATSLRVYPADGGLGMAGRAWSSTGMGGR